MLDNLHDRAAVAEMLSEVFLDLGDYVTGARRPRRVLLVSAWLLTAVGGVALWRSFSWLFDHYPGWAVLSAGFWAMLVVGTLALTAATIKHSATPSGS